MQLEKALELQLKTDVPDVHKDIRLLKDELDKVVDLLSKHESKAKHLEREIEVNRIENIDEPKVLRLMAPLQTSQTELAEQVSQIQKDISGVRMKMPKAETAALMFAEANEKIDDLEAKLERKLEMIKQQLFEFEDQVVGADTKKPMRSRIDELYQIIKYVEQV